MVRHLTSEVQFLQQSKTEPYSVSCSVTYIFEFAPVNLKGHQVVVDPLK